MQPSNTVPRLAIRDGIAYPGVREVAEECPVAVVFNGTTHAVLMATSTDLEDLALGFSLTEAIVDSPVAIRRIEVARHSDGIELRIRLALGRAAASRRRTIVGGSACGLCGIDSLAAAIRPPGHVPPGLNPTLDNIAEAVRAIAAHQPLGQATRAVHAAGFWTPARGMETVREDVGRHNALDKLAGALAHRRQPGPEGILVLTSRVSVEMVQKAARIGVGTIAAVSAPTALAIRTAQQAGILLAAIVRDDGLELFTNTSRLQSTAPKRASNPASTPLTRRTPRAA